MNLGHIQLNRIGLGTMRLTSGTNRWGPPEDIKIANYILKKASDIGVNFFDTADAYGPEFSEKIICEALYPYKDIIIATKGGNQRLGPDKVLPNGRPEYLIKSCKASLERLNVAKISLYQLHAIDPLVPLDESIGALMLLKSTGLIDHIGVCNVTHEQLEQIISITPVFSVQNRLNVIESHLIEQNKKNLKICEDNGITFIAYYPLAKGDLTNYFSSQINGFTMSQTALINLLSVSKNILAIPGTRNEKHLMENFSIIKTITP